MVGCIHLLLLIASYMLGFGITYVHCIKKKQIKGKGKAKDKQHLSDREKSAAKKKPPGNKACPAKASPNKFKFDPVTNHLTAAETELKSDADANLLGKTIIRDKILKPIEAAATPSPQAAAGATRRDPVKPKPASVYGGAEIPPEIRSVPVQSKAIPVNTVKK